MLSTLILLYALDNGQTPNECFIAAWVFLILEIICAIVKEIGNLKNKDLNSTFTVLFLYYPFYRKENHYG